MSALTDIPLENNQQGNIDSLLTLEYELLTLNDKVKKKINELLNDTNKLTAKELEIIMKTLEKSYNFGYKLEKNIFKIENKDRLTPIDEPTKF